MIGMHAARMVPPEIGYTLRTAAACREQARARAQCIMETFDGVKVGTFVNAYLQILRRSPTRSVSTAT